MLLYLFLFQQSSFQISCDIQREKLIALKRGFKDFVSTEIRFFLLVFGKYKVCMERFSTLSPRLRGLHLQHEKSLKLNVRNEQNKSIVERIIVLFLEGNARILTLLPQSLNL